MVIKYIIWKKILIKKPRQKKMTNNYLAKLIKIKSLLTKLIITKTRNLK